MRLLYDCPMPSDFRIGVKGVLTHCSDVLLLRASWGWDLPGGRIEIGEEPIDALIRELSEELPGINNISVGELVGWHRTKEYVIEDKRLILLLFEVRATLPNPIVVSEEHDSAEWLPLLKAQEALRNIAIYWDRLG